jgi:tetratricopeptide (TPR) repeat protein
MNYDYLGRWLAFGVKSGNFLLPTTPEISVNSILSLIILRIGRHLLLLGLVCTLAPHSAFLSELRPNDPLQAYPMLMDTLMGGHYAAAEDLCEQIAAELGDHPAVYYAKSTTLYSKFFDLEDTTGRGRFLELVDSCLWSCRQYINNTSDTRELSILYYLRGSALSIKGLTYRQDGRTFSVIQLLMESHSAFDKAIKLNPEFFDAFLGRGAYRYGVAREASGLTWLPFMPSKQSGLDDIWLAVQKSAFSCFPALSALVWFAVEDGQLELADSICTAGLTRYPNARGFLWPRLSIQKKRGDFTGASETAECLLNQYSTLEGCNGYDATGLYATLSVCADSLGNPELAREYARRGLEIRRSPYAEDRRVGTLDGLKNRLKQQP